MGASQSTGLKEQGRYPIIDALRIVLAFWVTTDHLGVFPLFAGADPNTTTGRILSHGWSSVFWGVPAVICFFVISGFCIHLPYCHNEALPIGRYYVRRYVRILLPVCAILSAFHWSDVRSPIWGRESILWKGVLWSLACEELYYAIYPLARWVRIRHGWTALLSGSFATGVATAFLFPDALDGSLFGVLQAAVILYPIWLLGSRLAEESSRLPVVDSAFEIWKWRFFAWFGSWIFEMIHFKGKLPLGQTLLAFGVLAFFWIRKELAYSKHRSPARVLAWAGLWSYSLYLVHIPGSRLFLRLQLPTFGYVLDWCLYFASVFAMSYAFYLCVERPSHRLARKLSNRKARQSRVPELVYAPAPTDSFSRIDGGVP